MSLFETPVRCPELAPGQLLGRPETAYQKSAPCCSSSAAPGSGASSHVAAASRQESFDPDLVVEDAVAAARTQPRPSEHVVHLARAATGTTSTSTPPSSRTLRSTMSPTAAGSRNVSTGFPSSSTHVRVVEVPGRLVDERSEVDVRPLGRQACRLERASRRGRVRARPRAPGPRRPPPPASSPVACSTSSRSAGSASSTRG